MTGGNCKIIGCEKIGSYCKGMCQMHYTRVLRYGDPNFVKKISCYPDNAICKIDGCKNKPTERYLCRKHVYQIPERRIRTNKRRNQYLKEVKNKIFSHYGNKCVCCGEDNLMFLTIDHVNNDGNKQRLIVPSGSAFYLWIKRNNYPTDLQIMCYNCNLGRARNLGTCPHKLMNSTSTTF